MPENSPAEILPDGCAGVMPAEAQRQAARMAQDAFAAVFRLSADSEATGRDAAFQELAGRCRNWCAAGTGEDGRALRRALRAERLPDGVQLAADIDAVSLL